MTTVSAIIPAPPASAAPFVSTPAEGGDAFGAALERALWPAQPQVAETAHGGATAHGSLPPAERAVTGSAATSKTHSRSGSSPVESPATPVFGADVDSTNPSVPTATEGSESPTGGRSVVANPTSVPSADAPAPSVDVQLPSEALAAFVAALMAMVSQSVTSVQPVADEQEAEAGKQVIAVDSVDGLANGAHGAGGAVAGASRDSTSARALAAALAQLVESAGVSAVPTTSEAAALSLGLGAVTMSDTGADVDMLRSLLDGLSGSAVDGGQAPSNVFEELVAALAAMGESPSNTTLSPEAINAIVQGQSGQQAPAGAGESTSTTISPNQAAVTARAAEAVAPQADADGVTPAVNDSSFATAVTVAREVLAASGVGPSLATDAAPADRAAETFKAIQAAVAVAEVGEKLNLAQLRGSSQVTVQLDPGSLGTVQIDLQRTSAGVSAVVTASTVEGKQLVEQSRAAIQKALADSGVSVTTVQVVGPTEGAETSNPDITTLIAPEPEPSPVTRSATSAASTEPVADSESTDASPEPVPVSGAQASPATVSSPRVEHSQSPVAAGREAAFQLVRDISDQLGALLGQGKSEFQIQLRPDTLGRLGIRMTLEDGAVSVRMSAESAQAKSMIESNLGQLKQAFQDQGIRVDRFAIVVGAGQQLAQDHQHPRRSRGLDDQIRSVRGSNDDGDFAQALASVGGAASFSYLA